MAGYNYFPATYQPNYYGGMYNPQPQIPQVPTPAQAPQQQSNSGLIWVQGESGAKSSGLSRRSSACEAVIHRDHGA